MVVALVALSVDRLTKMENQAYRDQVPNETRKGEENNDKVPDQAVSDRHAAFHTVPTFIVLFSSSPPHQKINIEAYACLMLIGIGCLLPYNFFITPELFWQEKLSTTSSTNSTNELNWMQNFWQNFLALGQF